MERKQVGDEGRKGVGEKQGEGGKVEEGGKWGVVEDRGEGVGDKKVKGNGRRAKGMGERGKEIRFKKGREEEG